jgi:deoxyribodipyrimidine photolyase-related protein
MPQLKRLRLILGDQLNERHSWFQKNQDNITYVLMEVRQETDYVKHHIQKVASFFAAMRAFSHGLIERGHRVIYLRLDDPSNDQNFETNLKKLIRKEKLPFWVETAIKNRRIKNPGSVFRNFFRINCNPNRV